jgi:lipopolysaccharide/colanic/teichoic acid biosynthesis glycosyltransferase
MVFKVNVDIEKKDTARRVKSLQFRVNYRVILFYIADILLVTASFLLFIWMKPASLRFYLPYYLEPFLIFLGIWLAASIPSKKYAYDDKRYLKDFLSPVIISDFIALSVITVMIVGFNHFAYSRMIVFGTIGMSIFLEIVLFSLFYYHRKLDRESESMENVEVFLQHMESLAVSRDYKELPVTENPDNYPAFSLGHYKEQIIQEINEDVYDFLCSHVDNHRNQTIVTSTTTRFNIETIPSDVFNVIINLKLVNDIKFVNKFFEMVNKKLPAGGLFIGTVETNEIKKAKVYRTYPKAISWFIYFTYHYIFKRVFPKVFILKKIYFFITNGFERAMSKAEAFGRLYSCGFEVVSEKVIKNKQYFVARKIADPVFDMSPTYGPVISLKRVGKNGKIIHVYKLRTMHPFAEYLQDYVYKHNDLQEGGKFKDDFRVSTLGKLMRKFWIDELPMIFNILNGDLKIVGVRPLSRHYFGLYTKDMQERRTRYRPGLVPPFYVDLPKTLDEIMASEKKYMDAYDKHPVLTDIRYFFMAFYNILIKKARSN